MAHPGSAAGGRHYRPGICSISHKIYRPPQAPTRRMGGDLPQYRSSFLPLGPRRSLCHAGSFGCWTGSGLVCVDCGHLGAAGQSGQSHNWSTLSVRHPCGNLRRAFGRWIYAVDCPDPVNLVPFYLCLANLPTFLHAGYVFLIIKYLPNPLAIEGAGIL